MTLKKALLVTLLLGMLAVSCAGRIVVSIIDEVGDDFSAEFEREFGEDIRITKSIGNEVVFDEMIETGFNQMSNEREAELEARFGDDVDIDEVSGFSFNMTEDGLTVRVEGEDHDGEAVVVSAEFHEEDGTPRIDIQVEE